MSAVRWSVDPRATTPLRFDDPEFLAALVADADKTGTPLAKLLDLERAADADFSAFVADGVVLNARDGITASEEDQLQNKSQQDDARQGIKMDVARHNQTWFATWVTSVTDDQGDASRLPRGLSDPDRRKRQESIGAIPAAVRGCLFARLRVHVDHASKPAMRDPKLSRPAVED